MRLVIALFLVVSASSSAVAANPVVGDLVFVKDGARVRDGDIKFDIELLPFPAEVEDTKGDLLWLTRAWVHKDDVMTIEEALTFYSYQIQREPKNAKSWRRRGDVWGAKRDFEKSEEDYTEAIRLDQKDAAAYARRGANRIDLGRIDNAISDYDEALRLDPKCARALWFRGIAWGKKTERHKAITDFDAAIQLDPKNPFFFVDRGYALLSIGRISDAVADFDAAIQFDKMLGEAYGLRGWALVRIGNDGNAASDFEAAMRLKPKWNVGYSGLAWVRATSPDAKNRDGKSAVKLATKACETSNWADSEDISTLAAAYAEAGDWENAIKRQQQYIEIVTTEIDKRDGRERLELYKRHRPCRNLIESPVQRPLLLRHFILENLGTVLVGLIVIAMGYFGILVVLPILREEWGASKKKVLDGSGANTHPNQSLDIVTVANFRSLPEAEACKLYLESEGITAFLADTETVRMDWLLSNAIGYAKVQVPKSQFAEATSLLEKMPRKQQDQPNDTDTYRCLSCGATIPADASNCQACGWSYATLNEGDAGDGAETIN